MGTPFAAGEGNGGPIDPNVVFIRDSFVGMARLLDAMAAREMKISQLADELPRYEIHKTKVSLDREKIPAALRTLEKHFADATAIGRLAGGLSEGAQFGGDLIVDPPAAPHFFGFV